MSNINNSFHENLSTGKVDTSYNYIVPSAPLQSYSKEESDNMINEIEVILNKHKSYSNKKDLVMIFVVIGLLVFSSINHNNINILGDEYHDLYNYYIIDDKNNSSSNIIFNDTSNNINYIVNSPYVEIKNTNKDSKKVIFHNPDLSTHSVIIKNGSDAMCETNKNSVDNNLQIDYDEEYHKKKLAPGVRRLGLSYDPITDTYGESFLEESFEDKLVETDPIDGEEHKVYDYTALYQHNTKHYAKASSNTYRDVYSYKRSKTNQVGGSVGIGSFLSASGSSSKFKAVGALSGNDKAVIEQLLKDQLYEITAKSDLTKYVKKSYIDAVTDLPAYNKSDKSVVDKYDTLSAKWKDFFVVFVGLGGLIIQQIIISNASKYYQKYSEENIEGGVSGGWGPFSASVSTSQSTYSSSEDLELKSDTTSQVIVSGGSAKGDLDNPSESITNINNWDHSEYQKHFDRTEKNPSVISERVMPVWFLFEGDNM